MAGHGIEGIRIYCSGESRYGTLHGGQGLSMKSTVGTMTIYSAAIDRSYSGIKK